MTRTTTMTLVACVLFGAPAMAQQNWDTIQVRPVPVAPGLYMLMGAGGNIGVSAGPDGVFLRELSRPRNP